MEDTFLYNQFIYSWFYACPKIDIEHTFKSSSSSGGALLMKATRMVPLILKTIYKLRINNYFIFTPIITTNIIGYTFFKQLCFYNLTISYRQELVAVLFLIVICVPAPTSLKRIIRSPILAKVLPVIITVSWFTGP